MIRVYGGKGFELDGLLVGRAFLSSTDHSEAGEGSSSEERREEVEAIRDGVEVRGKDGLGDPYDQDDVDEHVDQRSTGDDHANVRNK